MPLPQIYEFLQTSEALEKMIVLADAGYPPLDAVIEEIEKICCLLGLDSANSVGNELVNQSIGKAIRYILKPFGYEPVKTAGGSYIERQITNSERVKTSAVYRSSD